MTTINIYRILSIFSIILINCLLNFECGRIKSNFINSNSLNYDNVQDVPFSRKKRALTFPAGSTIQLAFDQTMPIVAAQLLFTIGVTVALAYELPEKPLHRITDEIRQSLHNRLHPSSTMATPSMNDTNGSHSRIDYDSNNLMYINNNKDSYYNMMNKHKYYYGNSTSISANDRVGDDVVSKKVVKTYINKEGQKIITMKIKHGKKKKKLGNVFLRKHNRVYPVFGKRSVENHLTQTEILYMDHHRNSRFEIFEKIQKFLDGNGKNGTGCVLKALCETAQKNQKEEKAPFLIEILRAVFTLPHQVMPYKKDSHQVYDDAHSSLNADCAVLYPQCKDSIWSPNFCF